MSYSNIFAEFYDQLFSDNLSDLEFYKFFIKKNNSLALEIGSGTGRLLLKLLESGLNVEGVEPSKEMLDICLKKAKKFNLKPVIYQQSIENLKIEKKYKTIYMPLFVFQHLDKDDVQKSLKNCYMHLEENGEILISIFMTENYENEDFWTLNTASKDGKILLYEMINFDKINQIQIKKLKLEICKNKKTETYFSEIQFKIYTINEIKNLLEKNGFKDIEIFSDYSLEKNNIYSDILAFKAKK